MDNIEKLGYFIIKKYKSIILISVIFTLIMLYFLSKLTLNMQFMDILPKTEPTVISYKSAVKNFKSLDNIIVGIEGKKKNIESFIEDVAKEVKTIDEVESVEFKIEEEFLKKHGLLLVKEKYLRNMKKAFEANSLKDFFEGINDNFEKTYISNGDVEKIDKEKIKLITLIKLIEDIIKNMRQGNLSIKEAERFLIGEKYFISNNDSLGIFIIKSNVNIDEIKKIVKTVNRIEFLLKKESKKYNVEISLTGTHVIARDEMIVTEKDSIMSTLLSLILIFILFILTFKLLRYSLLVLVPLVFGLIWSLGLTYLIIGNLNMITAMMGAILIGLGIDYSIHIIVFFLEEKKKDTEEKEIIILMFKKVIKGVITGALTTAIGFMMFIISDFPGFSQFGIVLGLGIICALLAAIFLLPSLLIIFGRKKILIKNRLGKKFEKIENLVIKHKKNVFFVMSVIFLFFGMYGKKIEFETDMMKIEPENLKSVLLNRKIIENFDFSSDNTLIVSDTLTEVQDLYEKADKLNTIGQISSLGSYLPSEEKQVKRLKVIGEILKKADQKLEEKIDIGELSNELFRLESNIIEISDLAYMGGELDLSEKCDRLIKTNLINELAENLYLYKNQIEISQIFFIESIKKLLKEFENRTINIKDIPKNIKDNYIGKNNKFLTILLPKDDLWRSGFQKIHMQELNTLKKNVTGSSIIFLKVIEAEIKEGKRVIILTLIVIYLLLLIDMKSFKYSILAVLPMLFAVILTMGIMHIFKLKLDVVNIIGLPLIIGIGVDDGVHIIHRYLREDDLLSALNSTGKAITLTTLTTIAAFGTLIFSKYRGFVNFGRLLSIGVLSAYLITVFFLVSLIAIVDKKKS